MLSPVTSTPPRKGRLESFLALTINTGWGAIIVGTSETMLLAIFSLRMLESMATDEANRRGSECEAILDMSPPLENPPM